MFNKIKITNRKKVIVNDLIENWFQSKSNIKLSSYTRYYNLYNQHIKNDIGKYNIKKINSNIVNNYLLCKINNGKINGKGGLSKNTVYDIVCILKQVFKENNIKIDFIKISKKVGVGRSLSYSEKETLIKKLDNIDLKISIGILLSLLLGLRESEVCGIKWEDIDLNGKVICINRIVSRVKVIETKSKTKIVLSTPKTDNSKRILPIPDKIYIKLMNLYNNINDSDYLLTGNSKYMDPRTYYNKYKKILESINLDYSYHDLRHTFATNCVDVGIDYKSLMELLGHSNISTTMNVYIHPTMEMKRNYVNKL